MPSSNVIQPMPLWSALSIFDSPPSRRSVPTSLIRVVRVTEPDSRAVTAVIILKTDPGS